MSEAPAKPNQVGSNGKHVAQNVRRLRGALGWSTYELSARLAKVGRPIAASSITNIESGRRRVDADDLVAIAVVFDVNPSALLFPISDSGSVELTGGGSVSVTAVWEWADGERPLRLAADAAVATEQWARFLRLARPESRRRIGFDRMRREVTEASSHLFKADESNKLADELASKAEQSGNPREVELATKALQLADEYSEASIQNFKATLKHIGLTQDQLLALYAAVGDLAEDAAPEGRD